MPLPPRRQEPARGAVDIVGGATCSAKEVMAPRPVELASAQATHGGQPGIAVPMMERRVALRPLQPRVGWTIELPAKNCSAPATRFTTRTPITRSAGRGQLDGVTVIRDRRI
jgi:hypothetical protein